MKRIWSIILAALMLFAAVACGQTGSQPDDDKTAGKTGPMFVLSDAEGKPGDAVTVNVEIRNNPGLWGMDLAVDYDKKVLTLTEVTNGSFFGDGSWTPANPDAEKYILSYELEDLNNNTKKSGVLATLHFRINGGAASGKSEVRVSWNGTSQVVINNRAEDLPFTVIPGVVTVNGASDALTAAPASDTTVPATPTSVTPTYLPPSTGTHAAETLTPVTPTYVPPTSKTSADVTPTPTETPTPSETPEPERFEFKISIAGDCMLASYKNQSASNGFKEYANREDPAYFLSKVRKYFEGDDLTVVNLECVLSDKKLTPTPKEGERVFWYLGKTSNTDILTVAGVESVSLANNHSGDYGREGKKDTVQAVKDAGLLYGNDAETFYYEKEGFTVAVICNGLWGEWQAKSVIERIKEASEKSDFQIVYFHGGKERIHEPEAWKVRASRALVDAGADLVIGNHPHVLQPRENYNGVDIVYSVGNFCYGGNAHPENRTMIYQTTLTVEKGSNRVVEKESEIIPCYVYTGERNNFQPTPIENAEEKQIVLDFMDGKRELPY